VSGELALLRAKGYSRDDAVQRLLGHTVACDGCGSGRIDAAAAVGAGLAPPPAPPAGGGGTGSAPPGAATVVGPAPTARPASHGPPKTTPPRTTTAPRTIPVTEPPPTSVPPTSPPSAPFEAALGNPGPGQVQVNNAPSGDRGSSSRLVPVGLALAGLLGAATGLGVAAWRRPG